MRFLFAGLVLCAPLAACNSQPQIDAGARHGRYQGIGTYPAGRLWSQMTDTDRNADPAAATLADDEQIVVVVDAVTGEVRQCGNLSGHCIAMNPWTGAERPVRLGRHAADLEAEDGGATSNTASAH
jgi:hypothetical protein